jgi:hypothetical protein
MKKSETIVAIKGFDANLRCREFQFAIGETYTHDGKVSACESGFHACEYALDVFGYYPPSDSRYCIVEQSGEIDRHADDSKIASASITVKAEIRIPEIVTRAVDWIIARIDRSLEQSVTAGDRSAATNTGYRSAATNTGDRSAATNTGYQSAATNTGYRSAATNTGYQSAATNTGDRSAATNTGNWSAATNTGYQSAATNTGYQSAATNTGDRSAATNTGNWSAASVEGKYAVAISTGTDSKAMASKSSAIVLVNRDAEGAIRHIRASKVGENGIEAGKWYALDDAGEFVEATP